MKISSLLRRDRPLDRSMAWVCVATNQFVTPGLGSLFAGRILAGLLQFIIAFAGFLLIMDWFLQLFKILFQHGDFASELSPHAWMWKRGLLLFGAGWLLALDSSIRILRQARRTDSGQPPKLRR